MPDSLREVGQGLLQSTLAMVGFIPTAAIARWLYHHRMVRLGQRRLWGRDLLWELPAVFFGAILGGGMAEWMGATGLVAHGITGVVAWLGPVGLEEYVLRPLVRRYAETGNCDSGKGG